MNLLKVSNILPMAQKIFIHDRHSIDPHIIKVCKIWHCWPFEKLHGFVCQQNCDFLSMFVFADSKWQQKKMTKDLQYCWKGNYSLTIGHCPHLWNPPLLMICAGWNGCSGDFPRCGLYPMDVLRLPLWGFQRRTKDLDFYIKMHCPVDSISNLNYHDLLLRGHLGVWMVYFYIRYICATYYHI